MVRHPKAKSSWRQFPAFHAAPSDVPSRLNHTTKIYRFTSNGRQHYPFNTYECPVGSSLTETPEGDRRGGGRPSEEKSNQHHNKSRRGGRRGGGKVRVREHGFPATEVSRCQSEPREEPAPKRQTLGGRKPHTQKLCCHKSVNTFSRVGARLAY